MRNVTLRTTGKGTAVVLEQVILVHKELFDSYEDAVKYAASLNLNEAFRRNRNREISVQQKVERHEKKEGTQNKNTEGQRS